MRCVVHSIIIYLYIIYTLKPWVIVQAVFDPNNPLCNSVKSEENVPNLPNVL